MRVFVAESTSRHYKTEPSLFQVPLRQPPLYIYILYTYIVYVAKGESPHAEAFILFTIKQFATYILSFFFNHNLQIINWKLIFYKNIFYLGWISMSNKNLPILSFSSLKISLILHNYPCFKLQPQFIPKIKFSTTFARHAHVPPNVHTKFPKGSF